MTNVVRPPLPTKHFNPKIREMKEGYNPVVKFQKISRPPREVMVGRIKIQTPSNGHAFVLRRYDTGAISITTLFRAAFPTASEQAERDEINWVAHTHDLTGANGGRDEDRVRFSGRWAAPDVAVALADDYGLGHVLPALLNAKPDEPTPARITANGAKQTQTPLPHTSASPGTPYKALGMAPSSTPASMTPGGPPPSKRRKESSPGPTPTPARGRSIPRSTASPAKRSAKVKSPSPAPVATPKPVSRRSTRLATRSPSAQPQPQTRGQSQAQPTPARGSPRKKAANGHNNKVDVAPASDETAVNEGDEDEDEQAEKAVRPSYDEDVREQQELIAKLKAQREREAKATKAAISGKRAPPVNEPQDEEEDEDDMDAEDQDEENDRESQSASAALSSKRPREDENGQFAFKFKEPEVTERALVANSRTRNVVGFDHAQTRSALWGGLALVVGFGAASVLPSFLGF